MTARPDNPEVPPGRPADPAPGGQHADELLPQVYDELRRLAQSRLANDPAGLTLQPTALVHEAYMRIAGDKGSAWANRAHFFAAAATAMRRILIERARRKRSGRAALAQRQAMAEFDSGQDIESVDLLALDAALDQLSRIDSRLTEIVQLRFFAGLTVEQTAEIMGVGARTVKRDWNFARAWLRQAMLGETTGATEQTGPNA